MTLDVVPRTRTADKVVKSICPYCAVGCGQLVFVENERITHIEGDPDSPISQGCLCPKGAATYELVTGSYRQHHDLQNSDCIVIQGSNMAECHPVGFRWVMEAKARGATIIHVDPRFTRTSAVADVHVPIRAGSDIAFLGGIVRYIIENDRYFRD